MRVTLQGMGSHVVVEKLASYIAGSWFTPSGDGHVILDANTGEPVVVVSSEGIDFAHTVEYARTVGGPELRRFTFRDRVGLVEALASHLADQKTAFYELSNRAGNTRHDAAFDIGGGINALFVHAKKGKTELPDGRAASTETSSGSASRGPSPVSTSGYHRAGWRYRSTPTTSPSGHCWGSWPRH